MWSRRRSEALPAPSPLIRHQSDLTERDWKNTVQGLGKTLLTKFKEFIFSGFHSQISHILHSHVNKRIPVSANNFLKTTDNSYPSGFAAVEVNF